MASVSTISTKATSEQTALCPMSRKVLASAGVAAFVLSNRSRVEILNAPIYPLVMENKIIDIRNYSNVTA